MSTPSRIPILICGAGPTGLTLASYLQRWNVPFRIVDKARPTLAQSRALVVQARTLELFQQLGLVDRALSETADVNSVDVYSLGKKVGHLDFKESDEASMPFPFAAILPQDKTEEILIEDLEKRGVGIEWDSEVGSIKDQDRGAIVKLEKKDGTSESIHADYLIGADGAHSTVRHQMKTEFLGGSYERSFMLCDVEIDWELEKAGLMIFFEKDFFTLMMPFKEGKKYRIITLIPEVREDSDFDFLKQFIEHKFSVSISLGEPDWTSVYRVHHRCVERFTDGCMILAGDAAHIHSPAGGQGMNTGIQDAQALAWRLALIHHGHAQESILDDYHDERWRVAQHLVHGTDRAFKMMASTDPKMAWLRTHLIAPAMGMAFNNERLQHFIFHFISQTGVNYEHQLHDWNKIDHPHFKSGIRFPWFKDDLSEGGNIYSLLQPDFFRLFMFDISMNYDLEDAVSVLNDFSSFVKITHIRIDQNPHVCVHYDIENPVLVLVRPDMHIACVCQELSSVYDCLKGMLGEG